MSELQARVFQGRGHGAEAAVAVLGRSGDVVGVARQAVADHLGVDRRAAGPGVFVLLQHQHPGALAHDEAAAVLVVGPRGLRGPVVEVGGHGPTGDETGHADRADRGLGAAGHHDVGVAVPDHPGRVADGVRAGGAGGDHRVVGPLEAVADRHLARGQVDQGGGNEERA